MRSAAESELTLGSRLATRFSITIVSVSASVFARQLVKKAKGRIARASSLRKVSMQDHSDPRLAALFGRLLISATVPFCILTLLPFVETSLLLGSEQGTDLFMG